MSAGNGSIVASIRENGAIVIRRLIDGYNVMFAIGALGGRLGPGGLQRARLRFLNDLAARLGGDHARETVVVFDAPATRRLGGESESHHGLTIVFAVGDESADARIEAMIAAHPVPKSLTVVSSDHRIRTAARRRRATALTADDFWEALDAGTPPTTPAEPKPERPESMTAEERALWLRAFADVEDAPETRAAFDRDAMLTDDEIERLQREIDEEDI